MATNAVAFVKRIQSFRVPVRIRYASPSRERRAPQQTVHSADGIASIDHSIAALAIFTIGRSFSGSPQPRLYIQIFSFLRERQYEWI
jgi:hypothetical protein